MFRASNLYVYPLSTCPEFKPYPVKLGHTLFRTYKVYVFCQRQSFTNKCRYEQNQA